MFHVLLALPAMAAFGAAAGVVAAVLFAVLALAFLGGFLMKIVFRGLRWLLALPVLLGGLLSLTVFFAAPAAALSIILIFWVLYGAAMLMGWLLASVVKLLLFWLRGL